jgi:RimJ/RimL family protein N-acetyltransferase
MDLQLRPATYDDMDLLYKWANDKDVRKNSFNSEPIPYEDHVKWFGNIMSDETVLQYIMCEQNIPIGQIRLNIENDKAYIGYSISAPNRGKGLGVTMLRLLISELHNIGYHNLTLIGQVKYDNLASAKAFEKCGFIMSQEEGFASYQLLI